MDTENHSKDQQKPQVPQKPPEDLEVEKENLGLDADHSSDTAYHSLNNDNDRISGNPDGETDDNDGSGPLGDSPLMEK